MNQPEEFDSQPLQQATSRQLPAGAALDGETAAMRTSWLALGQGLDAENASFDEQSLLARLAAPANQPVELARKPTETSQLWPMILGTALALAMMVAVVRTVFFGPATETLVVAPAPAELPLIVQGDSPTITHAPETMEPESTLPAIAAWSDPLDDQIERATEQLRDAVANRRSVDDSLTSLQQQLEDMSADLTAGSL